CVIGETRERARDGADIDFRFVRFAELEDFLRDATQFGSPEMMLHGNRVPAPRSLRRCALPCSRLRFLDHYYFESAIPTFTLRKRAGDAPCPVPIVCMGWPLPQFGVPQSVQ